MSVFSSLLKNVAVYSVSNILNALIPFLLLPVLTRVLIPSDYGILAMFYSMLAILGAFTGLSVHGAVNSRFVDRENVNFPQYVGSCLVVLFASTCFTFVSMFFLKNLLYNFVGISPFWLLMAVIVSGCNFIIQIRLGLWMMEKKTITYCLFQVVLSTFNVGFSLLFVLLLKMGYEGRLWGHMFAVVVFAFGGYVSLVKDGLVKYILKLDYIREILSFGVPLIPHVVGMFLISFADRFIIHQQLGLDSVGIYMVAFQIAMGIGLLADAFNKAYVPWLYEQLKIDDPTMKRYIVIKTWCCFGIALCCALVVALSADSIIRIVAGSRYLGASKALAWLALGQAFAGMYFMVANYIFYKRKTAKLSMITLCSGGVGVGLAWVLTPVMGVSGAGLAFAVAMCLRFIFTWKLAHKVCPMPWFSWR